MLGLIFPLLLATAPVEVSSGACPVAEAAARSELASRQIDAMVICAAPASGLIDERGYTPCTVALPRSGTSHVLWCATAAASTQGCVRSGASSPARERAMVRLAQAARKLQAGEILECGQLQARTRVYGCALQSEIGPVVYVRAQGRDPGLYSLHYAPGRETAVRSGEWK